MGPACVDSVQSVCQFNVKLNFLIRFLWSGFPIDSILAQVSNKVSQIDPNSHFLIKNPGSISESSLCIYQLLLLELRLLEPV